MSALTPWLGPWRPAGPLPRLDLGELEALESFALLAPAFTHHEPNASIGEEPGAGAPWLLLTGLCAHNETRERAPSPPRPGPSPTPDVGASGSSTLWFCPYERAGAEASRFVGAERWVLPALAGGRGLPCALDGQGYVTAVEAVREAIAAGDVYQVNLTLRALARAPSGADLLRALCRHSEPRFGAWVRLPDGTELVSASPELLAELDGSAVRVEPMKGTAPPDSAAWLEASDKDRAELAMITDLLRDDLQRLCRPRSVRVPTPRRLVRLPYAVQAVSDVVGTLADGVRLVDVVDQLHPGGSVTGTPRAAACELIDRLEPAPRGPYCGLLGLASADEQRARFALLIRTATRRSGAGDTWEYGVGSGVTWDSQAEAELAEVRLKLGALQ